MHHAFGVRGFQRIANLIHDANDFFVRKLALMGHQGLQILPLDELHGDELDAVRFAKIENANHVFVRDLPRQNQFLLEAMQRLRLRGEFRPNYFQRHEPLELAILGFVNSAHAALAKQIDDFVARSENRAGSDLRSASRSCARIRYGPAGRNAGCRSCYSAGQPVRDIGAVIPIVASDISSELEPGGVAPVGIIVGCAMPIVASS